MVFNYKDRTETVVGTDEQQLTNTLIKVLSGAQRTVYFLQGHGEHDTAASARDGYSTIYQALGTENYKTDTLALAQKPEVPANATVLVIAGPRTDLLQGEVDAIKQYLDRGGKLLVMLDPPDKNGQQPLTNLIALLKEWGIEAGNDIIVDTSGVGQLLGANEVTPVAVRYPTHPIVDRFRVITAYPLARSIKPVQGGTNGRTAQTFVESSPQSWGETNIDRPLRAEADRVRQGQGRPGPGVARRGRIGRRTEAAAAAAGPKPADAKTPAADAPKPETRVAAIGDSDFASNGWLGVQGNRDLFLNTVSWLSQQENLISIRPRDPEDRRLTMSAQTRAEREVALALLVIPCSDLRARHLRLDEETGMRGGRSLLVLFVAFGGLLAYLYFVDAKKPVTEDGAEKHDKVFTVDADKVEGAEGQELLRRDRRRSRRARTAGSSWSPSRRRWTRVRCPGITSNLSSAEIQSVVDEAPKDLQPYGLASRASRWPSRQPATRTTGACSWAARRRPAATCMRSAAATRRCS